VHKLAPNAIGDGLGGNVRANTNFGGVNGFLQGGYTFKAASNNNAIPQDRVYYSYQYLSASSQVDPVAGPPVDVDLQQHVFGFEKLLIGDIYALGVQIPVQYQLASELNLGVDPVAQDTEIGNMTVYSKHILYQSWRTTLSGGFALGLPTGDEFSVTIAGDNIRIENDAWTLTPYLATLFYDPCNCYYLQLFGQLDFSLDDNEVYVNGANAGNLQDVTLFRFDVSYGYWLSRDCCNNGIVAIAELHYATSLSGEDILNAGAPTAPIDVTYDNNEQLNATFGVGVLHNCWSITPALSLPLLDSPNRSYDWEAQLLLQRRL
jgi:hypothetical protein